MTKKRKNSAQEFRNSAVKLTTEQGYKISDDACILGVNESVLARRKHEAGAR